MSEISRWRAVIAVLSEARLWAMVVLGFSAGVPLLLIFSALSLWLREAGVERAAVTFFSWAALAYSFKFVWAPLIDTVPLPGLTRWFGRRRAWLLAAQLGIIGAIVGMALHDPARGGTELTALAGAAVALGLAAATQDIVIDALRIESAPPALQGLFAAAYIAGYRLGMIATGAGALYLAAWLGSSAEHYSYPAWRATYLCMASVLIVGIATTLALPEPATAVPQRAARGSDYLLLVVTFVLAVAACGGGFFYSGSLVAALGSAGGPLVALLAEVLRVIGALGLAILTARLMVRIGAVDRDLLRAVWIQPVRDFFARYGVRTALLLLALIGLYRIADIVLGAIANVFYQELGFTKTTIATAVTAFGTAVGITGGLLGGVLAARCGTMPMLMLGAILAAATNLVFIALAHAGADAMLLYFAVAADNLAGGLAGAAFVAFLSHLTSVSFTAVQYALFSSLMTLLPKLLGGYSGSLVDALGYPGFFLLSALLGVPVVVLVWLAARQLRAAEVNS